MQRALELRGNRRTSSLGRFPDALRVEATVRSQLRITTVIPLMSQTIARLKTDHRRMRNVLGALEALVQTIDIPVDIDVADELYCLVTYLSEYPDEIHHPLEDAVFTHLGDAFAQEHSAIISELRLQHKNLVSRTQQILEGIDEASSTGLWEELRHEILEYVSLQRMHMDMEEQGIFPLAYKILVQDSFADLDILHGQTSDPLFDKVERKYASIYKYLELDPNETALVELGQPLYKFLSAAGQARI